MNNEKQYQIKVNYNPITNVYTPSKDISTQKTPLNQNMNNNQIIQNNDITNENTSLNSTNNTVDNTQNAEAQIKELITNSLNKLKSNFIFGGSHLLFSFQRKLSLFDINHKGLISLNNFLSAAQSYTMLSQDELKIIFDLFDRDKTGSIIYNELIQIIVEPVSPNRKLIIQKIYDNFNKDNNGKVPINEIKLSFNARRHPDVISGKKSEREIFGEFLDNIESYREYMENMKGIYDNKMSLEDFINFYIEVGAGFEDDKMFEFMINSCWNLDNNNNNLRPRNIGGVNTNIDNGLSRNRYRSNNNNGFGYRNNGNNNINSGNMMARAGSQIIKSKGFYNN
jgi:Ca2+-binding EF-hand superfamily protein